MGTEKRIRVKMTAQDLGQELRDGTGNFLGHRRVAASLTLVGMTSLAVISLYQIGIFKRLPEPSSSVLDAGKVNGSAEAYGILNTPDAVLGLGSYAATLGLIAMGGPDRARSQPWIPLALAAKSSLDSFQAGALTGKSWCKFRAFSLYSLVTALCTFLVLPFVLPEARAAWKKLKGTR
jgi:hypothetical protein